MSTAREDILARIHQALGSELGVDATARVAAAHAALERQYRRAGVADDAHAIDLLKDRLLDYDADVVELGGQHEIARAVEAALRARGEGALLTPAEVPPLWLPDGITCVPDEELTVAQIEPYTAVLTTCEVAVAETGTIALVHLRTQGRRVLTLLPDNHIIVLRQDQVVETVAEAWERLAPFASLPITTVSGPSATSDIEMTRVRGVHGPRHLTVLLCASSS